MLLSKFLIGDLTTRLLLLLMLLLVLVGVQLIPCLQLNYCILLIMGLLPPWAGCLIIVVCTVLVTFLDIMLFMLMKMGLDSKFDYFHYYNC